MQTSQTILDAVQHALAGRSATARVDLQGLWDHADPKDAAQRCVIAHYLADQQHDLGDDIAWDERALSPGLFGIALAAMMAIGLLVTILTWSSSSPSRGTALSCRALSANACSPGAS